MFECRICGNREGNRKHVAREMMIGLREEFEYIECASCGCLQIAEVPANLGKYYPAEKYYSYQVGSADFRFLWRNFLRRERAAYVFGRRNPIGLILAHLFGEKDYHRWLKNSDVAFDSSILDVGCGGGGLLLNLLSEGFKSLTGVDPYLPRAISYGKGLEIFNCHLSDLRRQYDFIMLNHSFEHMPEPRRPSPEPIVHPRASQAGPIHSATSQLGRLRAVEGVPEPAHLDLPAAEHEIEVVLSIVSVGGRRPWRLRADAGGRGAGDQDRAGAGHKRSGVSSCAQSGIL